MTRFSVSDPWHLIGANMRAGQEYRVLLQEIVVEVGPRHELFGQVEAVIARRFDQDEVVVQLSDATFALIHMTWSGHIEKPPWPQSRRLGNAPTAMKSLAELEAGR